MNEDRRRLPPDIAIACTAPELRVRAAELAARLALPLAAAGEHHALLLRLTHAGLELLKPDDPQLTGTVRVDFTAGAAAFRRQQPGKELLLRACGCKGNVRPAVIDATGGLGRDSFVLAAAGCQVRIFEREPMIAALLADGLERARLHPETAAIAARIALTVGDAAVSLNAMQAAEVIYLDPMFPERRKTALVKKELQLLQLLAAADPAADQMLLAAALAASRRVAVKRPAKAPFLAGLAPSCSIAGKAIRFDVYLRL